MPIMHKHPPPPTPAELRTRVHRAALAVAAVQACTPAHLAARERLIAATRRLGALTPRVRAGLVPSAAILAAVRAYEAASATAIEAAARMELALAVGTRRIEVERLA